jgi:hypothetical protein
MTTTTKMTIEERNAILATLKGEQARALRELCDDVRAALTRILRTMGWKDDNDA